MTTIGRAMGGIRGGFLRHTETAKGVKVRRYTTEEPAKKTTAVN